MVPKFFTRKIEPAKGCCCFSSGVKRALKFRERFKLGIKRKKKKIKGKRSDNEEEKEPIPSLPCCHIFASSRPTPLRDFHSYGMQSAWLSLSSRKTSKTATSAKESEQRSFTMVFSYLTPFWWELPFLVLLYHSMTQRKSSATLQGTELWLTFH